jgi:hypothetical protein
MSIAPGAKLWGVARYLAKPTSFFGGLADRDPTIFQTFTRGILSFTK